VSRVRRSLLGLSVLGSGLFVAGCVGGGPPPVPLPSPVSCVAQYSPCVPIAADVDCAGGGGDGPVFVTGPIQVIGVDIYDLDPDGDGVGC
jgi:hypothetical protein